MAIERSSNRSVSLADVLDRILDKGLVIDAWIAVSVIGIELITIEARVIVASLETYVKYSEALYYIGPVAGGIRAAENRKSLGQGLSDLSGGLQSIPAVGQVEKQLGGTLGSEKKEEGRPVARKKQPAKRRK